MTNLKNIMNGKMIHFMERLQDKVLKIYKSNIYHFVDDDICREIDNTVSRVIEEAVRGELIEKYILKGLGVK